MTFGQKVPKLNSRPVYCSRLYGNHIIYFGFSPVCRKDKKEGVCPKIMRTGSDCGRPDECSTDADCIGEKKCCFNDCGGKSCLPGDIFF